MQKLLEKCGSETLELADNLGWMPVHHAAHLGNTHAVQAILKTTSSLAYIKDNQGMSALHISARNGQSWVTEKLVEECPNVSESLDHKGGTTLHVAVENARINVVQTLLEARFFNDLIIEQDIVGNTALHVAAIHENYKVIETLVKDIRVDRVVNKRQMTAFDILITKSATRFTTFEQVCTKLYSTYYTEQNISEMREKQKNNQL